MQFGCNVLGESKISIAHPLIVDDLVPIQATTSLRNFCFLPFSQVQIAQETSRV